MQLEGVAPKAVMVNLPNVPSSWQNWNLDSLNMTIWAHMFRLSYIWKKAVSLSSSYNRISSTILICCRKFRMTSSYRLVYMYPDAAVVISSLSSDECHQWSAMGGDSGRWTWHATYPEHHVSPQPSYRAPHSWWEHPLDPNGPCHGWLLAD